jgi:molybdopterin-guanine dinucleotide biosynthesis protein A
MPDVLKDSEHTDLLFSDITGVILAGGKSRRYGRNKAFEKVNGIPLIERVLGVMRSVFQNLILITNTPDEYAYLKLPVHQDLIKGLGPVGGIFTALTAMPDDAGFFVACDMPFLKRELIRHIVEKRGNFDVVVPRISGKMETLHALYDKRCLPAIRRRIDSREYQVFRFFSEVSVRYVNEDEIRRFDPELRSFLNINKPQELRRLNNR